ncbi:MAG: FkbM family methyltransferase [Sedimentisphaerales bacterium]|nr:FkbM family methyltransferase [Sedimentisphaerales bacterium]
MRNLLFSIFKKLRKVENFLYRKVRAFLFPVSPFERDNRDAGKKTLLRRIARIRTGLYERLYDILKPRGVVLVNIQGNRVYVNAEDRGVAPMLLMDGEMEEYETQLFRSIVKEGMVVADIGANIGYYTLIAARLVGDSGRVYAFEPEPMTFDLLCRNVEMNCSTNVIPVRKAISNRCSRAKFWVDKTGIAISSFSKGNVLSFESKETSKNLTCSDVETIALDEFFETSVGSTILDFLKVDTQGAEGLIVEGAEKILRNNDVHMLMEFWPQGLRNVGTDPSKLLWNLESYGFQVKLINERNRTLEPIENIDEFCTKAAPKDEFNLLLEK